jgi:hypothetical protein
MSIVLTINELPEKIARHVTGEIASGFAGAFKTNIKPNATIPLLWLVIHKDGLLFCNTHRTRGIFQDIKREEIDSFKFSSSSMGSNSFSILFKDLMVEDLHIELPKGVSSKAVITCLRQLNLQILE